jgi:hypothetical protein
MLQLKIAPLITITVILLLGGWSLLSPADESTISNLTGDPCYLFTDEADYLDFDLRLHLRDNKIVPFRVPVDYIEDNTVYPNGGELTAKSFRVGIEYFEPVSRPESGRRNKEGIWDWMHFLFQSSVSLEQIALNNAYVSTGERRDSIGDYQILTSDFGLDKLSYKLRLRGKESYIVKLPDGQISDVFRCSQVGQVPFPGCSHFFEYEDISVKVTYRRTELFGWRGIRTNLEQFLTCAISS